MKTSIKVVDCQTGEVIVQKGTPLPLAEDDVKRILYGLPLGPRDCGRQGGCVAEDVYINGEDALDAERFADRVNWTSRDTSFWLIDKCPYVWSYFRVLDEHNAALDGRELEE